MKKISLFVHLKAENSGMGEKSRGLKTVYRTWNFYVVKHHGKFLGLRCEGSMTLSQWGVWVSHYFQPYNCFIMSTPTFFCLRLKKRPIVDAKSPSENKSIIIHLKYLRLFWGTVYFIWDWNTIFLPLFKKNGVKSLQVLKRPRSLTVLSL